MKFRHKNLTSIKDLSKGDVENLFSRSIEFVNNNNRSKILKGKLLMNVFFENSTRTRISFEIAAKKLGAEVVNFESESSSLKKGETLIDTAKTLNSYNPDYVVIRNSENGSVNLLAKYFSASVINAGDGNNDHPTQALLDAFTIQTKLGSVEGKIVAICGDILHSRVARPNIHLLKLLGAEVRLVGPSLLMPQNDPDYQNLNYFNHLQDGIRGADVVMMLRVQKERIRNELGFSEEEFTKEFCLTHEKMALAGKRAIVMHPGPLNRGIEIESSLADDPTKSVIELQVYNGLCVRQALLELLEENK